MEKDILDYKQYVSNKKYGTAVCISGIFGIFGIHHFYLERYAMGLLDLGLSISAFYLIFNDNPYGYLILGIDFLHTVYVTYKLLVGEYADGNGYIVAYPGQKNINHSKKL